ncbi:MAG: DUF6364 family protein [bacterium]
MQTKLTLRVDQQLISRAKAFAKTSGKSLSLRWWRIILPFLAAKNPTTVSK